jgi:hypothetical protein
MSVALIFRGIFGFGANYHAAMQYALLCEIDAIMSAAHPDNACLSSASQK